MLDASLISDVAGLREELLTVLEHALFGDRLAAEFLLCHLASTMYDSFVAVLMVFIWRNCG